MNLTETVQQAGLTPVGDPPAVDLTLAGKAVRVLLREVGPLVECQATVAVDEPTEGFHPATASLSAPGDTAITVERQAISVTRRLASPSIGVLYDVVHEVGKGAVSVARMLNEVAELTRQVAGIEAGEAESVPLAGDLEPPPTAESMAGAAPPPPAPPPPAAAAPPPPTAAPTQPVAAAEAKVALWWGYVQAPTVIMQGDATRTPVATLQPGTFFAVVDEQGDWLQVDDGVGHQGWLGRTQFIRHQ